MKTEELEKALGQLTEHEEQILFDGISYHAALILLKLFPNNAVIQELVDRKRY
jgi:hypothetical protein